MCINFNTLISAIFIFFTGNIYAADGCKINFLWGHGGAGNVKARIKELGITGKSIYQGCGVGGSGDIKYQVWQTGYNGDWMGHSSHIDNGGFNPIMHQQSREILDGVSGEKDKETLKDPEFSYANYEARWAASLSKRLPKISQDELISGILSSGFARLTQYHWAGMIKEAGDLISSGRCQKVQINFICHDQNYTYYDHLGKKVTRGDLDDKVYSNRIRKAKFDHISIDKNILLDTSGNSAVFEQKTCYEKSGKKLENIPLACNESHEITSDLLLAYKSGPCGSLLKHVTPKYKKTRALEGRAEIFSPDKDVLESSIQGRGTTQE